VRRSQLEHLLRAAARVINESELLVIGSQSILGTFSDDQLPPEAVRSMEADLAALNDPDDRKADQIDGAIGEGSRFHETFGVYGQGVSVSTAVLPKGWESRLVELSSEATRPGRGLCLERHDCALSKLVAGRERDYAFASALFQAGLLDAQVLAERIEDLPVTEPEKDRIRGWLRGQLRA